MIVISGVFPFIAQSYAVGSVEAQPLPSPSTTAQPTDPPTPTSAPPSTQRPADLGIRTLPLLSDEAVAAWKKDPAAALEEAGTRLLGNQWLSFMSASLAQAANYDFREGATYNYSGNAGKIALEPISLLETSQEQITIDVIGLLILNAAKDDPNTKDPHGYTAASLSLAQIGAAHFKSCDSLLTNAYTLSLGLRDLTPSFLTNQAEQPFADAISSCPHDPTPMIEQFKYRSGNYSPGDTFNSISQSLYQRDFASGKMGWDSLVSTMDTLAKTWPDVAATHVVIADTYIMMADTSAKSRMGSFSMREFLTKAASSYQVAAEMSSLPSIQASLIRTRTRLANTVANTTADPFISATMTDAYVLKAMADSAAHSGNYNEALAYEQRASTISPPPELPIVEYDRGSVTTIPGAHYVKFHFPYSTQAGGEGGSGAQNLGFVPPYRVTDTDNTAEIYSILAEAKELLANPTPGYNLFRLATEHYGNFDNIDTPFDYFQDLFRKYGDFDSATQAIQQWTAISPSSTVSLERRGEVLFLQGKWSESTLSFRQVTAAHNSGNYYRYSPSSWPGFSHNELVVRTGPGWSLLGIAAASRLSGQNTPEVANLATATANMQTSHYPELMDWGEVDITGPERPILSTYTYLEEGQYAYDQHDYTKAIELLNQSITARDSTGEMPGVQEHVISLCYFAMNQPQESLDWAQKALAFDPFSPLYQETVADAKRALAVASPSASASPSPGQPSTNIDLRVELIAEYQATLDLNPSMFSSWNNLGVLLAQSGRIDEAVQAFENAITARRDYPMAWFNLGVAEANRSGFWSFLRSQGALGQAGLLNTALKDLEPVFTFDDEVYSTSLDVSKPIPPDWQLASSLRSTPNILTAGLIALIVLRVGWSLGQSWFGDRWAAGALRTWNTKAGPLARFTRWRPHPLLTTLVTAASLLWLSGTAGTLEVALCATVIASLLGLHAFTAHLIARAEPVRHRSFPAASLVTLLLAPFGLGFTPPAPLAAKQTPAEDTSATTDWTPVWIRRIGLITIGAAVLLFATGAWLTAVPAARTATTVTLTLISSALLPVHPLDGARLGVRKWIDLAISAALIAATILFALQIL